MLAAWKATPETPVAIPPAPQRGSLRRQVNWPGPRSRQSQAGVAVDLPDRQLEPDRVAAQLGVEAVQISQVCLGVVETMVAVRRGEMAFR